ncbi:MAG: hypothetical protein IPG91_05545 [Ideonella sp.]|nr:hypothetical protein [Ideonella sp.]
MAYFLPDDDLWDRAAWEGLPTDYQRRLHDRALRHRPWVERHCDALWVSTEALARKYAQHAPQLIPLMPDAALLAQAEPVHVAYHGTASHGAEIEWLRSVMAEVLARCPQVHFELFGDWRVAHAWRELPRVAVLHPMKWPAYLAYTGAARRPHRPVSAAAHAVQRRPGAVSSTTSRAWGNRHLQRRGAVRRVRSRWHRWPAAAQRTGALGQCDRRAGRRHNPAGGSAERRRTPLANSAGS